MTKAEKTATHDPKEAATKADMVACRVRASIPARRRAGLDFTQDWREVTFAELGEDPRATIEILAADPVLTVGPPKDEVSAE